MLFRRALTGTVLFFALTLRALPAAATDPTIGNSCASVGQGGVGARYDSGNNTWCNGSTWQYPAYQLGSTTTGCNGGSAGMLQWTGSSVSPNNTFEFCNGSSWTTVNGTASSVQLSGIIAATTTSSIDSGANAITWAWNSLASNIALALTTTDLTLGTILEVENTSGGNSTGYAGYFENITTGAGYALYALTTGSSNSGYGVYAGNPSGSGYALYANGNTYLGSTTTIAGSLNQTGNAVLSGTTTVGNTLNITGNTVLSGTTTVSGALNLTATVNAPNLAGGTVKSSGYLGLNTGGQIVLGNGGSASSLALSALTSAQGTNNEDNSGYAQTWTWNSLSTQTALTLSTSTAITGGMLLSLQANAASATSTGYVLDISDSTTGTGYGGYFTMTGSGNSGYAGYFINTATSGANYGVYGTDASANGYGGYFSNTSTGYALYASGNTDIAGGLMLAPETVNVTGNDQLVTVGSHSFIQLSSNSTSGYIVCLSAGTAGQVLVLEDIADNVELENNATPCGGAANVHMASNWNATANDTLKLIYDGADSYWVGVARTVGNNTYVDSTAQTANISSTALATSSPVAGNFYKITCFVIVTTAATTSSTMPACEYTYTDEASSTHTAVPITATSNANSTGTSSLGAAMFFAKANTAIDYTTTGYASSGSTSMNYSVHVRLEQLW